MRGVETCAQRVVGAKPDDDPGVGQASQRGLQRGGLWVGDLQPGQADAVVAQGAGGVKVALPLDKRGMAIIERQLARGRNREAPAVVAALQVGRGAGAVRGRGEGRVEIIRPADPVGQAGWTPEIVEIEPARPGGFRRFGVDGDDFKVKIAQREEPVVRSQMRVR